ncbi:class I SAM-dependent methyltransferase [Nocardia jinanensis]|uniref:Methyltransferase n=1 Tax=Nocardia jinanensis TaxID=382504 RepID=A0A917R5L5_9NOCA|nr:class I SAM-dependent methyltransferase [Nocardia jinanensis]GGK89931.1 methyltransferase [Nocardia jinanensis]
MDWELWQRSWDQQQSFYLPEREERFRVMIDVVEAAVGPTPHVLDLAAGTGTITRRLFTRLPRARSVAVDIDPTMMAIARGSFEGDARITFVTADLAAPGWMEGLPDQPFDAVLTATSTHWLKAEPLTRLYADLAKVVRPGGVFVNADHMPDPDTPVLNAIDEAVQDNHRERVCAMGALDWEQWWEEVALDPGLTEEHAGSRAIFDQHSGGEEHPAEWHCLRLREAGFLEAGVAWRSINDAMVVAIR